MTRLRGTGHGQDLRGKGNDALNITDGWSSKVLLMVGKGTDSWPIRTKKGKKDKKERVGVFFDRIDNYP